MENVQGSRQAAHRDEARVGGAPEVIDQRQLGGGNGRNKLASRITHSSSVLVHLSYLLVPVIFSSRLHCLFSSPSSLLVSLAVAPLTPGAVLPNQTVGRSSHPNPRAAAGCRKGISALLFDNEIECVCLRRHLGWLLRSPVENVEPKGEATSCLRRFRKPEDPPFPLLVDDSHDSAIAITTQRLS